MSRFVRASITAAVAVCASCSWSQESGRLPIYRVTVVGPGIVAIHYPYGAGPMKVDFRGTAQLPDANGEARVQSRRGGTDIDARFAQLPTPTRLGRDYLAYVLWAISPDGNFYNLGEVAPEASQRARLRVTADLPAFAMMVTAEPYATVRSPSNAVVLENHIRAAETAGPAQRIPAKAGSIPRGPSGGQLQESQEPPKAPKVLKVPSKVSMSRYEALRQLYQAQNAVAIAQVEKADTYAAEAFGFAQRALTEAQRLIAANANDKLVVQYARESEQHAEDARVIAERRKQEEQLAVAQRGGHESSAGAATEFPRRNQADREVREPEVHTQLLQRIEGAFPTQDMPRSIVITLPDDAFVGSKLSAGVSEKLAPVAALLASHPGVQVSVQAYTGSGASELQSWERAQAIRNRLVESGVAANQVAFRGMSVEANRRIEIIISDGQ